MATTVGLLHPGEMGAVVGECLRAAGARVVWPSAGRSQATSRRARLRASRTSGRRPRRPGQRRHPLGVPPGGSDGRGPTGRGGPVRGTLRGRERRRARDRPRRRRDRRRDRRRLRRRRHHRPAAPPGRDDPTLPVRPAGRGGRRAVQGKRAGGRRDAGRRRRRLRPQDGVRRVDEGLERPPPRRAGAGDPRGHGRRRSAPSGSAPSPGSAPARRRPSPPTRGRPGASSGRWRRSPRRSRPPGCRPASTRRARSSTSGSAGTRTRRPCRRSRKWPTLSAGGRPIRPGPEPPAAEAARAGPDELRRYSAFCPM